MLNLRSGMKHNTLTSNIYVFSCCLLSIPVIVIFKLSLLCKNNVFLQKKTTLYFLKVKNGDNK